MPEKHLHIVAFSIPFPANYGGVIDIFYKLKALHKAGIKIHLHCFQYDRPASPELDAYCYSINYYTRKTGLAAQFSVKPYIVESRQSKELISNLLADNYPILFEGLHSCYYLNHSSFQGRTLIYREANIEHHYYRGLFKSETNPLRKVYFLVESIKLSHFQKQLRFATKMLAVSQTDRKYLENQFPGKEIIYLPCFHGNSYASCLPGKGGYVLYHGNLSVVENVEAAKFLVKHVFNDIDLPFKIAGMNPSKALTKLVARYRNIEIIPNPSKPEMENLIRNAQVNALITFQATGLKLKLLNTLYNGRWVLVNNQMLAGTGLDNLCESAFNAEEMKTKVTDLFIKEFSQDLLLSRSEILQRVFSDDVNAEILIREVWGD